MNIDITRRDFLKATAALVVAFGWPLDWGESESQAATLRTSGGPLPANQVDSWLIVHNDNTVTVMTGKVELGTGVSTSLRQIVADELDFPFEKIRWIQGDTANTVDQAPTFGSQTIKRGGGQLRQAAAEAKATLFSLAATRLGVPEEALTIANGVIAARDGFGKKLTFAEALGGHSFEREISGTIQAKSPSGYKLVGRPVPRVDIPGKITGAHVYLQNLRLPGMLHGRVIHPMSIDARLVKADPSSIGSLPGFVKVVVNENFVGVVCEREEQAIRAARELKLEWQAPSPPLPLMSELAETLRKIPSNDRPAGSAGDVDAAFATAAKTLSASYYWPYQLHASIGPSCAVADVKNGGATIWSATQGAHQLRPTIAQLLDIAAAEVRVIYTEASGCYGHNGADDAAAGAALLSQAVGRPVRVQWMRQDEHGWEPVGPAMAMEVRGGLDNDAKIVAWDFQSWTPTHSSRPNGSAGSLLAGQLTGKAAGMASQSGADRNANHTYNFKNNRVLVHWLKSSPLRASALRGLGSPQNTFANESFMDELALAAGADPVEFRLRQLDDERAKAVLQSAAKRADWPNRPAAQTGMKLGRGVAFVRYERTELTWRRLPI
jgi:nicotinate dehydrogenase subunit B